MKQSDLKRIKQLSRLHQKEKETVFEYFEWISTYFWETDAQEQIQEYLNTIIQEHGDVTSVRSLHPVLQERTPIHLPFLYRHDILFCDGLTVVLFQKLNFSQSIASWFTSVTWSYLANLSNVFRQSHRLFEKTQHHSVSLAHPHPRSLWENYKTFLFRLGTYWKNNDETMHSPVWVLCTNTTAVTIAIPGKHRVVGGSVCTHLINAVHHKRFQKKQFETLGRILGETIRWCYDQNVAFIDVGLTNYIIDDKGAARCIDGELLQMLPDGVPSHYKALELVMFMEALYIETVRDYCRTINSIDVETMKKYQRGLLVFFSSFLKTVGLSKNERGLAQDMYHDWSTKIGTFTFTFFLSFTRDSTVIRRYRIVLRENLDKLLDECV